MPKPEIQVRRAEVADALAIARLLRDFNLEYDEPAPPVAKLTETIGRLLGEEEITVLLVGEEPDAFALLRFRPGIWSDGLEAYLQELYESMGFTNREGAPDGPSMLFYEREI